ncbi:hypothetical protein D3C71_1667000 [compost metagenome]
MGKHEAILKPKVARYARDVLGGRVFTLEDVVDTFLAHMTSLGLMRRDGAGKWVGTAELATYEKNPKVRRAGRPGLAEQLARQGLLDYRRRMIQEHYRAIRSRLDGSAACNPEGWMLAVARRLGLTPFELAMESYLLEELETARRDVENGRNPDGAVLRLVRQAPSVEPAWPG